MYRQILFILLSCFVLPLFAQRQSLPEGFKQQAFRPDYSWQNRHLFDYDVRFYGLDLSVDPHNTLVKGNVTIGASLLVQKADTFAVELIPEMTIDSAFLNENKLPQPLRENDNVLFPVPSITGKGTSFSVKIYYHGVSPTGGFFSGVSSAYNKTWKKQVSWTLSEPFAAKSWFPVKEDLKDKADSAWIFLTVDSNYMAGSEGLLTRVVDVGHGKKRYEWKTHYPIDYYLLSYAVADYRDFSFYAHPSQPSGDSVLVQNFIYDSDEYLRQHRHEIERTARFIELYVKLFGPYPFRNEKYGHCLTELHGGMEHQTMTTIGGFGFDLVAHELGHMWFGDNVTCADWSDIWVNEGFATYADYLANEYINGSTAAQTFITKAQKNVMSQPGGSVYIPESDIYMGNEWRIFNGRLSYDKGAAILHMLRHEIQNDTLFFDILKTYQKQFAGGVATGDDFKNVVRQITGKDFSWFFQQWYYGEGYPVFRVQWHVSGDSLYLFGTETASTQNPSFFKILQDYRILFSDGSDTLVSLRQTQPAQRFVVYLPRNGKTVTQIVVDPDHWNLQKVTGVEYVGIKTLRNPAGFGLGPVPTKHWLYLQFYQPVTKPVSITVYDMNGRLVMTKTITGRKLKLDVSVLSPGLYVVRSVVGTHVYFRKFIR